MRCPYCGGNIDTREKRCPYCGATFTEEEINQLEHKVQGTFEVFRGTLDKERLIKRAETHFALGNTEQATQAFRAVCDEFPDDCRGWLGLVRVRTKGFTLFHIDDKTIEECEETIKKAIFVASDEEKKEICDRWRSYKAEIWCVRVRKTTHGFTKYDIQDDLFKTYSEEMAEKIPWVSEDTRRDFCQRWERYSKRRGELLREIAEKETQIKHYCRQHTNYGILSLMIGILNFILFTLIALCLFPNMGDYTRIAVLFALIIASFIVASFAHGKLSYYNDRKTREEKRPMEDGLRKLKTEYSGQLT